MFIAVLARPQPLRKFDGRIAIIPCAEFVTVQRSSVNRQKGDVKEVDVSVTAEYYRDVMEQQILPAIIKAMP
jgi:hypothetical protein